MELRHLEHFVAVADRRHFTRAAEDLSISQSGLSASIRALERELRAQLFVRHTRSVELTEAGRALLAECRRTLTSAAAARDAVAAVQGLLRGRLSVGVEQCIGVVDVPDLLAAFRTAHPGVEVALRQAGSVGLLQDVHAGHLDLALVSSAGEPVVGVTLTALRTEPILLVCHPEHPLAERSHVTPEDLDCETFVGFDPSWGARTIVDAALAAAGVRHRVELEVNDVHTLLELVGHGLGVALVPAPIAAKPVARVARVAVHGAAAGPWQVSVATPATGPSVAAKALLEMLPA
ncbi:LysR family transcriptional regulator [Nocardiopsis ansamitocini]|uniref:Transcriptional regulator n=1 Tax=Nocardiopsis ansamitocini TaxID=1670832 RepID=A0A9W6UHD0_9ACTN|nr:LysR family transcriptional regulator [Nocardiopsis ansamitocini]GLU48736.1 transcriptional regulator [Nocardiopsis ansamitocini]